MTDTRTYRTTVDLPKAESDYLSRKGAPRGNSQKQVLIEALRLHKLFSTPKGLQFLGEFMDHEALKETIWVKIKGE